jgi:uncharacterized protein YdaU (DUF1376 family)
MGRKPKPEPERDVRAWRKRWINDVRAETMALTGDEATALEFLRDYYWQHDSLPDDLLRLTRIARLNPDQSQCAVDLLEEFFPRGVDGQRRDQKLDAEKITAVENRAGTCGKATEAANKRWQKWRKEQAEAAAGNAPSNAPSSASSNAPDDAPAMPTSTSTSASTKHKHPAPGASAKTARSPDAHATPANTKPQADGETPPAITEEQKFLLEDLLATVGGMPRDVDDLLKRCRDVKPGELDFDEVFWLSQKYLLEARQKPEKIHSPIPFVLTHVANGLGSEVYQLAMDKAEKRHAQQAEKLRAEKAEVSS